MTNYMAKTGSGTGTGSGRICFLLNQFCAPTELCNSVPHSAGKKTGFLEKVCSF